MTIRKVLLGGLVASAVVLPATAASAAVTYGHPGPVGPGIPGSPDPIAPPWQQPQQKTFTAETYLTNRPDSGGNGNWADDTIDRTITITETGHNGGTYDYTAVLKDTGTFKTINGAFTPNQGAPNTGRHIKGADEGQMSGTADFTFTATKQPNSGSNLGVPTTENGAAQTTPETTSDWYEQAFPTGTQFGGTGIGTWSWTYTWQAPTSGYGNGYWQAYRVYRHHHWTTIRNWVNSQQPGGQQQGGGTQKWTDASSNNDGQLPGDGNITGI